MLIIIRSMKTLQKLYKGPYPHYSEQIQTKYGIEQLYEN